MVVTKKQCTKCKRMLPLSNFRKNKRYKDGLHSWCKECCSRYQKERNIVLKREAMIAFGGQCNHVDDNGVQCSKNEKDNLRDLELSHPNGDGDEHRSLISNGQYGSTFYRALQKIGYDTGKFVVEIRCKSHHVMIDQGGKKHPSYGKYGKLHPTYKRGKFNNPDWLKKKYKTMSSVQIAILCGVSDMTIRRRMEKFGHPRRKPWQRP